MIGKGKALPADDEEIVLSGGMISLMLPHL